MTGSQAIFKALKELQSPSVLASRVGGEGSSSGKLGARWLVDPGDASCGAELRARAQGVLDAGRPVLLCCEPGAETGSQGGAELLLEPVRPGGLAPWIHFCSQQLDRGKRCALATVLGVEGGAPYALGDRFAYDDRSHHGLLPIDGGLSIALTRASARALESGEAFRQRFPVPGGAVELLVEALHPDAALQEAGDAMGA